MVIFKIVRYVSRPIKGASKRYIPLLQLRILVHVVTVLSDRYCACTPNQVCAYQLKASGPLIDRLDIILTLQSVGLHSETVAESSEVIRKRKNKAHVIQKKRYHNKGLNGTIPSQSS